MSTAYQPLLELASGGIGTVDVALHRGVAGFERLVVTKRLHKFILKNADALPMFRDEARVASSIRHPNVVPVIDVVEAEGELLLVMEYVEGVSLSALLRAAGAEMKPPIAVRIVCDALAGLHGAHEATDVRGQKLEIVHRDVSPQNILVGLDGTSRVIDFGIAKAAGRLTETQSGYIKGKSAYMSPEQIESMDLDRRSDVFSAAVVLFEALTSKQLFQAESDMATLRKVLKATIPEASSVVSGIPPELDSVLQCALARDRDERFLTALAFQTALESALPPAPARDVAALMQRFCAEELEKRRRSLAEALGGTERLARTLPEKAPPILLSGTVKERAPAKETHAEGDTRVAATTDVTHPGHSRARAWPWIALAGVVGLGAVAGLAFWPRSHATNATPSATPTPTPIPIPTPTPTPDPIPTLTPTPTPVAVAKDAGAPRGTSRPKSPTRAKGDDLRHDFDPGQPF